jgi:ATP-binding cassette subfamily C protein LapB
MTPLRKSNKNLKTGPIDSVEAQLPLSAASTESWLQTVALALKVQGIALPLAMAKRLIKDGQTDILGQLTPLFQQLQLEVETSVGVQPELLRLVKPGSIILLPNGQMVVQGTPEAKSALSHIANEGEFLDFGRDFGKYTVHEFSKLADFIEPTSSKTATPTPTAPKGWLELFAEIRNAQWLMNPIRKHQPLFRELLLAALILNLLALVGPFFSMHLYDRIVPNTSLDTLWMMVVGVGIAYTADTALKLARHHLLDTAGQRIDIEVSQSIANKLFSIRLSETPTQPAQFLHQYRTFEALRELLTSSAVTAVVDLPFLALYLVIAACVHWALAIPMFINVALAMGLTWAGYRHLQKHSANALNDASDNHALWLETLQGLETLKSFSAGPWSNQKLVDSTLRTRQTGAHLRHVNYQLGLWAGLMQNISWLSVLVIGVFLIMNSELTTGALIACSMLAMRCASPISQWIGVLLQVNTVHSGFSSLNKFMGTAEESHNAQLALESTTVDLNLRNVTVKFPGQDHPALKNIQMNIKAGERVALIGQMGSGKTTLLRLFASFLSLSDGRFLINGRDHAQWQPSDLRDSIAYVGQQPFLFRGSLRDNLRLGRHWISDEQCYAALKTAGIENLASQHSQGLSRAITEGGANLSGGQRQAVALARVMLTQPAIVLLDEPANGLDGNAEESLKTTVSRLPASTTVIIATHKTSLLPLANRIVLMHEGEVMMDGPNEEVLNAMRSGVIQRQTPAARSAA